MVSGVSYFRYSSILRFSLCCFVLIYSCACDAPGPVLDMYGSYGAHIWVPWTVVLELRAAVAAILAESRSFDQLRQACALRRQPYNVWSGGFSAHS